MQYVNIPRLFLVRGYLPKLLHRVAPPPPSSRRGGAFLLGWIDGLSGVRHARELLYHTM
jgi:hypothetical protein